MRRYPTETALRRHLRTSQTRLATPLLACTHACSLLLPWPPTQSRGRAVANNRLVLTQRVKDYRAAVASHVLVQRRGQPPYRERLHLELDYHGPYTNPDAYDWDNVPKYLCDALTAAGVWEDDKLIYCARPRKGEPSWPGYVAVLIDLCRYHHCCARMPVAREDAL